MSPIHRERMKKKFEQHGIFILPNGKLIMELTDFELQDEYYKREIEGWE